MAEAFQQSTHERALARRPEVERLVQLSRSSIYAGVAKGTFPAPLRIGTRAVAWRLSDIDHWLSARPLAGYKVQVGAT
ncbi:MAG: AlpA family phage regulatory protein [Gammaproteobacteria bacterium]